MNCRIFYFVLFRFIGILLCIYLCDNREVLAADYFQQEVKIKIHVSLNDVKHELSANEELMYINHSPDTLHELYIHLWPNAYKNDNTCYAKDLYKRGESVFWESTDAERGYIDSLDFKINFESVRWELLKDSIDIAHITLAFPLLPGDSLLLTTPFHVKIPDAKLSRLGHTDQLYMITQWYPLPAVYDKNGWNYFPYLEQGEYYAEFGTYDVYISLPENYVVAATGELVDGEAEIKWLANKANATAAVEQFFKDLSIPASSDKSKTLHFRQDRVHDFAWFADKRWNVLKNEVELPDSKRKITTWSYFTNTEANLWKRAPEYSADALRYFSKWIGDYPYSSFTAVDALGAQGVGMEYPMLTTIGTLGDPFELEVFLAHEIGHSWFYGILGTNERMHPWMDEGMTNFLETRYVYTKYAGDTSKQRESTGRNLPWSLLTKELRLNHRYIQYEGYLDGARNNTDQSPEGPADGFSEKNYHDDAYYKSAISFDYLKSYLGDSLFDLCIHLYFDHWKFRHPQPEDLKAEFVSGSGKNLDWFFGDIIQTTKKLDYSICGIRHLRTLIDYGVSVTNRGDVAAPVSISSMRDGKVITTTWAEGFSGKKKIAMTCKDCDGFRINADGKMPELNQQNNSIRTKGIFRKTEKLKLRFAGGSENPERTSVYFTPTIGWNYYNGLMAGAAFYNVYSPEKKFEYVLMPMYGFHSSDLAGGGELRYHIYPKHISVSCITFKLGLSRYAYDDDQYSNPDGSVQVRRFIHYVKLDNWINFHGKKKDKASGIENDWKLRLVDIEREMPFGRKYRNFNFQTNYFQVQYSRVETEKLHQTDLKVGVIVGEAMQKYYATYTARVPFQQPRKSFDIRFFGGYLNWNHSIEAYDDYHLQLSGTSGPDDYMFDEVFLGRSETHGFWSHQFVANDAGFKTPSLFYRKAEKWMGAMNMETSLPGLIPFRVFASFASFENAGNKDLPGSAALSWEAGVSVPVIKDIFVFYFPVKYSNDFKYVVDNENLKYYNLIRFELHLKALNPLHLIRKNSYD